MIPPQEYRPDHVYGKLEERVCPRAIADCLAYRAAALNELDATSAKLRSILTILRVCGEVCFG